MTKKLVTDLRFSETTEDHLASHAITVEEALAVAFNEPRFFRDKEAGRLRMIGRTDEGRLLTIIVEPDEDDGGTCELITGWDATRAEKTAWQKEK